MSRFPYALAATVTALGCAVPAAVADDAPVEASHRVRFTVESARDVANDWVTAVVGVTAEDADAASAAATVNIAMTWALERVSAEARVESKSAGYTTHPVYEKGRIRRWRASQELVLESGDAAAMTALLGTLQERLELRAFDLGVSHATRERVERELVAEVLGAFQARARLVTESLGAKRYAIDEIDVDAGRADGPRPMFRQGVMAESSMAPPAVEAGKSRVTVSARGAIVLE